MAITVDYNQIGKGIAVDGVTTQTFYGQDFNPTPFVFPTGWTSVNATDETTSFNLSNFQPGHEVGCSVIVLGGDTSWSGELKADFYQGTSGGYYPQYTWRYKLYPNTSYAQWAGYVYFGVDDDEVWSGWTKFRIHYHNDVSGSANIDFYSPEFTVSNLSIDDDLYSSGYLRVEGAHLCYVDGVHQTSGYKHSIAYDNSYSSYVGSDKSGYIWLDDSDNSRIYYIDQTGTKRRTYSSSSWYGGNQSVSSSKKGYMRVADGDMEDGYGHLCFVAPSGSKRRILNGPPRGYS